MPESIPNKLLHDVRGLSSVEYLILLVVIVVAGISVWKKLGQSIHGKGEDATKALRLMDGSGVESTSSAIQERSDDFESGFGG